MRGGERTQDCCLPPALLAALLAAQSSVLCAMSPACAIQILDLLTLTQSLTGSALAPLRLPTLSCYCTSPRAGAAAAYEGGQVGDS